MPYNQQPKTFATSMVPFFLIAFLIAPVALPLIAYYSPDYLYLQSYAVIIISPFLGLAMIKSARKNFLQARLVEDTPTSLIRSSAQGFVKLKGKVVVDAPVTGPLSGENCDFWSLKLERYVASGESSSLEEVAKTYSSKGFIQLDDGTGKCYIPVEDGDWIFSNTVTKPHKGDLQHYAHLFDQDVCQKLMSREDWRLTEERIAPGCEVYALGVFTTLSSNKNPYDSHWVKRIEQAKSSGWFSFQVSSIVFLSVKDFFEQYSDYWTRQMRKLEGTKADAVLTGKETAHILMSDTDPKSGLVRHLTVSDKLENAASRTMRLRAINDTIFGLIVITFYPALTNKYIATFLYDLTGISIFKALILWD